MAKAKGPEITLELTSEKIEKLAKKGVVSTTLRKFAPKAYLDIVDDAFLLDSAWLAPKEKSLRKLVLGGNRIVLKESKRLIGFVTSNIAGKGPIVPDKDIAEMLGQFGREDDNYINLTNLQNALMMYTSDHIKDGKDLFIDPVFITMNRLYFAELIGEMQIAKTVLPFLGKKGLWCRHYLKLGQKNYEELVEYKTWEDIYKDIAKAKVEKAEGATEKNLKKEVKKAFAGTMLKPVGGATSLKKFSSVMERVAAATFSDIAIEHLKIRALTKVGKQGKVWVEEGEKAIAAVEAFLAKKNKTVLPNKDFIELCEKIGKGFTSIGIQSALIQIVSKGINDDSDLEPVIREIPAFSTLLRLWFAAMIMKIGVTELLMVVFGEAGMMARRRATLSTKDLNELVKDETYKEMVKEAVDASKTIV